MHKPVKIDPAIEELLYDDTPRTGEPVLDAILLKWHHEDKMREIREFDIELFVVDCKGAADA